MEEPNTTSVLECSGEVLVTNTPARRSKYTCTICTKSFLRSSSLATHIRSHTGEKPYPCTFPGCNRRFSVASNMRRHTKVHEGPMPRSSRKGRNIAGYHPYGKCVSQTQVPSPQQFPLIRGFGFGPPSVFYVQPSDINFMSPGVLGMVSTQPVFTGSIASPLLNAMDMSQPLPLVLPPLRPSWDNIVFPRFPTPPMPPLHFPWP